MHVKNAVINGFLKNLAGHVDFFRALIYPDRCYLCGKVIEYNTKVCKDCRKEAKIIRGSRCLSCGDTKKDCTCKGKATFYNGIAAAFRYEGVVRNGIALWKFREAKRHVSFFAEMVVAAMNEVFGDMEFDVITYVPQTKKESEERTYNQCEQLAQSIGKRINTPVLPLLVKLYETQRQREVSFVERSGNVFGVFECCNKEMTEGKKILLVDDVRTSGSTINECAKMLRIYGAESVYCSVIAVV